MNGNLSLVLAVVVLIGTGVYLLLERSLTRVLIGVVLAGNGVNVAFLVVSGPAGNAPLVGAHAASTIADPLPQAFVLTSIVINLGIVAFVLAMAYRNWQLTGHDDVQDDAEDAAIRRLASQEESSDSFDLVKGRSADDQDEVYAEEGER